MIECISLFPCRRTPSSTSPERRSSRTASCCATTLRQPWVLPIRSTLTPTTWRPGASKARSASRLDDRVFDAAMQAFNDLAARPRIQHVCKRPDCAHLYTSEVRAAEAEAEGAGCPLKPERTEGSPLNLSTYAFSRDKVITFDGTFFPNSSAHAGQQRGHLCIAYVSRTRAHLAWQEASPL